MDIYTYRRGCKFLKKFGNVTGVKNERVYVQNWRKRKHGKREKTNIKRTQGVEGDGSTIKNGQTIRHEQSFTNSEKWIEGNCKKNI